MLSIFSTVKSDFPSFKPNLQPEEFLEFTAFQHYSAALISQ